MNERTSVCHSIGEDSWIASCDSRYCNWSHVSESFADSIRVATRHYIECPHLRIQRALDLADEIEQAVERNQEQRLTPMLGPVLVSDATLREDIAIRKTARRIAKILRGQE